MKVEVTLIPWGSQWEVWIDKLTMTNVGVTHAEDEDQVGYMVIDYLNCLFDGQFTISELVVRKQAGNTGETSTGVSA